MPYERILRAKTPLVEWQDLRLLGSAAAWSEAYRPASARLLLPRTQWIAFDMHRSQFLCDRLGAVWLTPQCPYRMRQPWANQHGMVLLVHEAELAQGTQPAGLAMLPDRARCARI